MSAIRVPVALAEAQTGGSPALRVPIALAEVHTGGNPKIRAAAVLAEVHTGGNPTLRVPLVAVEVLMLPQPEAPEMSTIPFPIGGGAAGAPSSLPGLGWSVHWHPTFSTRIATHVSGQEIRAAFMRYPTYEIELTFEVLRADSQHQEMQTLLGFFLSRQGQFDTFLLDVGAITHNPQDNKVTQGGIGIGDGATTEFPLLRLTGGFAEPAGYVFPADLAAVYVDGGLVAPSSYVYTAPNRLVFNAAPAAGAVITASYFYYFNVRFAEDSGDYEEFAAALWTLQSLKLVSVLS